MAKERGQQLVLDLDAAYWYPAGDEAHDVGVGVEADQVVHVGECEPAQHQSWRFEEDLHQLCPSDAATLSVACAAS